MYPPPTRSQPAPRQQPSTLIGNSWLSEPKKRWRSHEKLGGSRFVRRSFSAHKYEPSPYVCQARKHHILCLSFRSVARCGRLTLSIVRQHLCKTEVISNNSDARARVRLAEVRVRAVERRRSGACPP